MLDDILKALRMDTTHAPRLSESNLRKLSRGLRSSKKSRLSVHSALETQSVQDGSLGGRSVSLSTLLPSCGRPRVGPRVDKLQNLEAKMANIEVSLGWRRRREALLETLPRAARDLVRELDTLHQNVRDKDTAIQSLRTQITNLGGTVVGNDAFGGVVSEAEKNDIQDRLEKVQNEMDAKRVAIKNIKLTIEKIDVTDNIDVRIHAAELEYELEREELNILNLKEESTLLSSRLQDSCSVSFNGANNPNNTSTKTTRLSFYELISCSKGSSVLVGTTLISANVCHTPGNPPFHVTTRPPFGCVIDWATDDTRLKKGDRLIEINGVVVIGGEIEELTKVMSVSSFLSLIVARPIAVPEETLKKHEKQLDDKQKENKDLVARLDKALRERDNFKNDNTRLNHRICYLEDQVSELEDSLKKPKGALPSPSTANEDTIELPTPSQPGATIIQVFQRGPSKANSPEAITDSRKQDKIDDYAYVPRIKPSASSSSSNSESLKKHNPNITKRENYFDSSSITDSSSSFEKCPNQGSAQSSISEPFKTGSSVDSHDHQISPRVAKPSSKDKKSYLNDDDSVLHKNNVRRPDIRHHGRYTSQNGINKLEKPTLSNRFFEEVNKSPRKQNDYNSPKERERHSNISDRQKVSKNRGTAHTSSPSKCILPKERENQESHNSRSLYQRQQFKEVASNYSTDSVSIKSQKAHLIERPRRFLSPGHDYNRNEQPEIKLPRPRPIPPKKPERLSLHRTTSLQSVEDARPTSRASSVSTSTRQQIISQVWHSCDNDLNTDGETDYEELRVLRRSTESDNNGYTYPVAPIPEERPPNPTPRNSLQKSIHKAQEKLSESERLSTTSVDSDYDSSPKQIYSKMKAIRTSARVKTSDSSNHLDTTLGLDFHHDVRAQPIYECFPKLNCPVPKPRERDLFHAPPTPNTPPRGVDLRVAKSYRSDEEWC